MSTTRISTPKRSPIKPTFAKTILNTKSTPNLSTSYNLALLQASGATPTSPYSPSKSQGFGLNTPRTRPSRQASLASLTSSSLSTIPDGSRKYALSTVFDEDLAKLGNMLLDTPSRVGGGPEELEVGDIVDVPGNMYGTVKFVGSVQGKKGVFAGVELGETFASKGKNNGDVDGVQYFSTSIDGAGIFLPVSRATRRTTPSSHDDSFPLSPSSPSLANRVGRLGSDKNTPLAPSLPKLGQAIGPGRTANPYVQKTRPSMATSAVASRPESPVRKAATARPSLNTPAQRVPSRYASPGPANFGQSVRGTQDPGDLNKKVGYTPRNGMKTPVPPRSVSALGAGNRSAAMNLSDEEIPPAGISRTTTNGSVGSVSSFNAKLRPASRSASRTTSRATDDEIERLRGQLEDRDRRLKELENSLLEMETSLNEMESTNEDTGGHGQNRGSVDDKDVSQLRAAIREKNDKIAMLTAEFDQHRADFRSTIDTLEMAGVETERVYEERLSHLVMELKVMQENSHDVKHVAVQLRQLEELVQELEEGLEDARRGEAEARGEVEFLRGEVERTRSELRREREKTAEALNSARPHSNSDAGAHSREISQRDDEIRGLKAIIHSLSRDAIPDDSLDHDATLNVVRPGLNRSCTESASISEEERRAREKLEWEVSELRAVLESKAKKEEQMERELEGLRRGSVINYTTNRTSAGAISSGTVTQDRNILRDSRDTVGSWRDREAASDIHHNNLETMPENDSHSSAEDFCQLCDTSGHDVLHCPMFGTNGSSRSASKNETAPPQRTGKDVVLEGLKLSPKPSHEEYQPAPLAPAKKSSDSSPTKIMPNPMEPGAVAGKESGVINMDKWCGVCERDGHDSIDCPFEDAF